MARVKYIKVLIGFEDGDNIREELFKQTDFSPVLEVAAGDQIEANMRILFEDDERFISKPIQPIRYIESPILILGGEIRARDD